MTLPLPTIGTSATGTSATGTSATGMFTTGMSTIDTAAAASHNPVLLQAGIKDAVFGHAVKVIQPVNLYGCVIGDNCFIGPFVEIQRDVRIGARTKVQSHSFICELVTIGDDCFVGHGAMFINDTFATGGPAGGRKELWRATHIGNRVAIGSNATIMPVRICDGAVIGAGAVVTRDITEPGIYAGNPARRIRALPAQAQTPSTD